MTFVVSMPERPSWVPLVSREGVNRDHASAVDYRGEIWWLGGCTAEYANLASVEIFDSVIRVWRQGPSILDGRFYILGGSINAGGAGTPGYSQVYVPEPWLGVPDRYRSSESPPIFGGIVYILLGA